MSDSSDWSREKPEEAPETCEWYGEDAGNCDRMPSVDLYEYSSETDDELWVCEGHFCQWTHGSKPPAEKRDEENRSIPVVAVRTKYENSPYGWTYTEDEGFAKQVDCKREKLVRQEDAELFAAEKMKEGRHQGVKMGKKGMRQRIIEEIRGYKESAESKAELQEKEHGAVQDTLRAEIELCEYFIEELEDEEVDASC